MNKMFDYILELIYPNVCGVCGIISKDSLCPKCEIELKKYEMNRIKKHNSKHINFDESMHIFKYEGIIRKMIVEYKFQEKSYLYKTFSKIILKNKKICGNFKKYDIIIPVPIHKRRKIIRGYNQTELIASKIAENSNLILENGVLFKQKNIVSQSELSKINREENVKEAFVIKNKEKVKNKKVLIFDDIYTTGSTIKECSRVLKAAGTSKIGILTIAKD